MNQDNTPRQKLMEALESRRKKEPTRKSRQEFQDAWRVMANEKGITEDGTRFLLEGYPYHAGLALIEYCRDRADGETVLVNICKEAAQDVKTHVQRRQLLGFLFTCIGGAAQYGISRWVGVAASFVPPAALQGQQVWQAAVSIMRHTLIALVDSKTVLPTADEMQLSTSQTYAFTSVMEELLGLANSLSLIGREQNAVEKLREWIHSLKPNGQGVATINEDDTHTAYCSAKLGEDAQGTAKTPSVDDQCGDSNDKGFSASTAIQKNVPEILESIARALRAEQHATEDLHKRNSELTTECQTLTKRVQHFSQLESDLRTQLQEVQSALKESRRQHTEDMQTITQKTHKIDELSEELRAQQQLLSVIERDTTSKNEERLNRLNTALRREYEDFREASDMPMTEPLGENIRDQLATVFSMLRDSGILTES